MRDHDHEISCNGILFYGAQTFAIHNLDPVERESAHQIFQLFKVEFEKKDPVHGEMLVSLLKVLIIILTRIGKKQVRAIDGNSQEIELIRRFNLLVDLNFRQQKQINDYAFELGVSAKKLSSTFKKAKLDPPLTRIHQRIILEAKRLLLFSLKSVTEISDELGFEDMSQFSKLFKKITNESPSQFKTGISERQSQEQQN
ncbi:transcriptional regulator, AraC family [Leptospira ryugenii]|uniref:Transcriptional regulator, AraC family n=1 Tax=Leptospira ryugenii TaxID=1917863 RepID=A0A2P2E0H2_9LEPT|nr:transcriptional regulator, AraC family [Leptospira ryugenii]